MNAWDTLTPAEQEAWTRKQHLDWFASLSTNHLIVLRQQEEKRYQEWQCQHQCYRRWEEETYQQLGQSVLDRLSRKCRRRRGC
jgi:hypothetical protein